MFVNKVFFPCTSLVITFICKLLLNFYAAKIPNFISDYVT